LRKKTGLKAHGRLTFENIFFESESVRLTDYFQGYRLLKEEELPSQYEDVESDIVNLGLLSLLLFFGPATLTFSRSRTML
jgi:hypothetical protein